MSSIDVHAHCVPGEVLEALRGGSHGIDLVADGDRWRVVIAGGITTPPLLAELGDFDGRVSAMDEAGIDRQLLAAWIDLTAYGLDPGRGARYSRMYNEALAATAARRPDRFGALATVPLQDPVQAAAELIHAVGELGMDGVQIATTVNGAELDDQALDPFWRVSSELGVIVLVHPYLPLAGRNVSRYFLDNAVGRPAETSIAVAHLIFGGVLERFPDLVVCVVHGGGFLPYQAGRLDRAFLAKPEIAGRNLTRKPSDWLRQMYFDTVTHDAGALAYLASFAGCDHMVMGTDYPFEMGDAHPVATVSAIPGLSDTERSQILGGTARRLLDGVHR